MIRRRESATSAGETDFDGDAEVLLEEGFEGRDRECLRDLGHNAQDGQKKKPGFIRLLLRRALELQDRRNWPD